MLTRKGVLKLLDPAVGDGELLLSLLRHLKVKEISNVEIYGFETDPQALTVAEERIKEEFPNLIANFKLQNFLEFSLEESKRVESGREQHAKKFDIIIANPPYVRTQIMGLCRRRVFHKNMDCRGV